MNDHTKLTVHVLVFYEITFIIGRTQLELTAIGDSLENSTPA